MCQTFFLKTLNIKQKTVYYRLNKKIDASISTAATAEGFVLPDCRGKNTPPNKTPDDDRAFVKSHIESFPVVESHYCQKNSHRKYLDSALNLTKMYDLYKNRCTEENRHPVKIHIYGSIFNSGYNYGFHKPKKDVCKVCDLYEKASPADKTALSTKYEAHLQRKHRQDSTKKMTSKEQLTCRKVFVQ